MMKWPRMWNRNGTRCALESKKKNDVCVCVEEREREMARGV